jgi:hypothetical protein
MDSVLEFSGKMDLAGDFDEAAGGVKMMAGGVLSHGFDHGISQTFTAKVIEHVLDQLPAQTAIAKISRYRKIRNAAFPGLAIESRRDITDDASFSFGDENARRIGSDIFVDVPRLAPTPVVAVKNAQRLLDVLFERYAGKRFDRQLLERFQVSRLASANRN